jgi:hypothetical protein
MAKIYFVIECTKKYKGEYADIDCDGTSVSDCDFKEGQHYRARHVSHKGKLIEWVIYPDNEWDGTYRYDYIKVEDFNNHFKIIRELRKDESLN